MSESEGTQLANQSFSAEKWAHIRELIRAGQLTTEKPNLFLDVMVDAGTEADGSRRSQVAGLETETPGAGEGELVVGTALPGEDPSHPSYQSQEIDGRGEKIDADHGAS